MDANGTLKAMADSLQHTGMNRYEASQWALERYKQLRAIIERTRRARGANGLSPGQNDQLR